MKPDIQIFIPVGDTSEVSDGLRMLTKTIHERGLANGKEGGIFGGEWGYGANFENDVFLMSRYNWDMECNCGIHELRDAFEENEYRHGPDCYQTELKAREDRYDEESGYTRIEEAAFGRNATPFSMLMGNAETKPIEIEGVQVGVVSMSNPRHDEAFDAWRRAHDAREKFKKALYAELCAKYKKKRYGCAVHCTCGMQERFSAWVDAHPHAERCPVELPNFWHKDSGSKINWYKYIGRGNEIKITKPWTEILHDCLRSLEPRTQTKET